MQIESLRIENESLRAELKSARNAADSGAAAKGEIAQLAAKLEVMKKNRSTTEMKCIILPTINSYA